MRTIDRFRPSLGVFRLFRGPAGAPAARGFLIAALITGGLFTLTQPACKRAPVPAASFADLSIVAAHTSGIISRESPIRVRFAEDLADSDRFNVALERSPFAFTPKINGIALWSDARTLEFRPRDRLPGGMQYTADVDLSGIVETEPGKGLFRFEFATIRQSFEITLKGCRACPGVSRQSSSWPETS